MKLAIMQPYFFPYIGYWQLVNAVDEFVIYDDVNFIKKGWINRNNILFNLKKKLITLSLEKQSQNKLINELNIIEDSKKPLLNLIKIAYKKAPYFDENIEILEKIILNKEKNLTQYLKFSINNIMNYLNINTKITLSSEIQKNNELKGEDKIIEICKIKKASEYINAIGGLDLYNKNKFIQNNINLQFIKMNSINYKQFNETFVPNLSIIDIMMFNSKKEIREMLEKYELL